MKDKIKQAGFKNQKELYTFLGVSEVTMVKWMKEPPKLFAEYIKAMIKLNGIIKIDEITENFIRSFKIEDGIIIFPGDGEVPKFLLSNILNGDKDTFMLIRRILRTYEEKEFNKDYWYNQYLRLYAFISHCVPNDLYKEYVNTQ